MFFPLKIGSPGVAPNAITVASYTTKAQWTDIDATLRTVGLTVDDISDFSSPGPARKGNHKPDVAAPGAMITSSLSADSFAGRESMVTDRHLVEAGTSMATPFIAGLVALLLQRNKALDPAGVKTLLQANSAIPGQPKKTFDPKWGYGVINAAGF